LSGVCSARQIQIQSIRADDVYSRRAHLHVRMRLICFLATCSARRQAGLADAVSRPRDALGRRRLAELLPDRLSCWPRRLRLLTRQLEILKIASASTPRSKREGKTSAGTPAPAAQGDQGGLGEDDGDQGDLTASRTASPRPACRRSGAGRQEQINACGTCRGSRSTPSSARTRLDPGSPCTCRRRTTSTSPRCASLDEDHYGLEKVKSASSSTSRCAS